ncbi:MAG: hypothetical protein V4501_07505 [Pseudomonadota bacterium]
MKKLPIFLMITALLSTQSLFAADEEMPSSKPCAAVADACVKAGFPRGKSFWFDCMKPVLLNKSVEKVTVDPATANACREAKIEKLKAELAEFENVSK